MLSFAAFWIVSSAVAFVDTAASASKLPPISAPTPPGFLRIRAVGDVMLGTDFPEGHLPPNDGADVLAAVTPYLADADLTFVNLEGPLCDGGTTKKCGTKKNCYAFRTPTSYIRYLVEAGVDVASTANNHSGDFGEECRRQTEATLDAAGIVWSGAPGTAATLMRNGVNVGLVAFHTSASCNHLNDIERAAEWVRALSVTHDVVIVSFHGGAEGLKAQRVPVGRETFFGEDRGDLRTFAHRMIDEGADLILGHGPHVFRAMEVYRERLIAYSLGNFATYGRFDLSGPLALSAILDVTVDRTGRLEQGWLIPTVQEGKGIPVLDPSGRIIDVAAKLTREDFPDTGVKLERNGSFRP